MGHLLWGSIDFIIFLISWLTSFSHGATIYGFPAMNFASHSRVLWRVGKELSSRGHNYIHVLPDIATDINLPGVQMKTYQARIPAERVKKMMENMASMEHIAVALKFMNELSHLHSSFAEDVISSVHLMQSMNSSADMILCDGPSNPTCLIVADILKLPRVDVLPMGFAEPFLHIFYGQPQVFVHSVDPMAIAGSSSTSFYARLVNVLRMLGFWLMFHPSATAGNVWEKYAKNTSDYDNFRQVRQAASMVLIQSDFAQTFPRPLHAHIRAIGPVLPEAARQLPDEFSKLAKDPFMVVSLGSVLSASHLNFTDILAKALADVNLRVLWKHTGRGPKSVGRNIHIFNWLPQNDLLGHPNARLFLTHAGFNSFSEALYHGVPMVALPLFGDQFNNAGAIQEKSVGVVLKRDELTLDNVRNAINETFQHPKYKHNALAISRIMKDRPSTPAEEAALWVEYVLRHNGAAHLRSQALGMPWYQEYMLDVFGFLFLICCLISIVLFTCSIFLCRMIYRTLSVLCKCLIFPCRILLHFLTNANTKEKKEQ